MVPRLLFSKRIAEMRRAAGMTQQALAEKIGISREQISKWESGKHAASMKTIAKICEAFSISEEDFWDPNWFPNGKPKPVTNTSGPLRPGPYLNTPTNSEHMALACPRCGATDFSKDAEYCRACAFPLYNFCTAPFDERHANPADSVYCEKCTRSTFWSFEYVTLEQIRGSSRTCNARNEEGQ